MILITPTLYAIPTSTLPVFNNFWYTSARDPSLDKKVCQPQRTIYVYENIYNTLDEIERYIVTTLPKHDPAVCTWQPFNFVKADPEYAPLDFPGDVDDYNIIYHSELATMTYSAYCINKDGTTIDAKTGRLYPSYTCAKGSMYFCPDSFSCRCYLHSDISCLGDVVGRDLNVPVISSAGHVGITVDINTLDQAKKDLSSVIVEVLNEIPAIQFNTLTSFKNSSPNYWGAKYNLPNYSNMTIEQVETIKIEAADQANYDPTYTFSWFWYPGGPTTKIIYDLNKMSWVEKLVNVHGRFRCDAFVYYLYQNLGITIPYSGLMTPKAIYDAFTSVRDNDPVLSLHKLQYRFIGNILSNIIIGNDLEDQIKQIFSQTNLDVTQADSLTYQYINDTTISRSQKIKFLWKLAQQYNSDTQKFTYLISILLQLKPTEIANDLITFYKSTQDNDEKTSLLALLDFSIYYDSFQETQNLTPEQLNGVVAIEQFFQQQLQEESNIALKQWLFLTNMNFLNKSQMNDLVVKYIDSRVLNDEIKALLKVQIIFSQPISDIAASLANEQDNSSIPFAVCAFVYLIPHDYLDTSQIEIVENYLKENKGQLMANGASMKGCDYELTMTKLSAKERSSKL